MNILALWRVPWLKSVIEWEDAQEKARRGDKEGLYNFVTKRLSEFWTPTAHDEKHELKSGGYSIATYETGDPVDGESGRCVTVDVQQTGTWFTIWSCSPIGELRLLLCGEALTFEDIEAKRIQYKIQKYAVLVDSQYRQDYVFQRCAEFGWTAFKGVGRDEFSILLEDGTTIKAPYSKVETVLSGGGKRANYINFCVNPIKDVISDIRAGRVGAMFVPDDVDKRFALHLDAEQKRVVEFGKEKKQKEIWVRLGKKANHMLDCTMAAVGFFMVKGWVKPKAVIEDD